MSPKIHPGFEIGSYKTMRRRNAGFYGRGMGNIFDF
jgi:hypothetical protein